jgi:hypothetical protein
VPILAEDCGEYVLSTVGNYLSLRNGRWEDDSPITRALAALGFREDPADSESVIADAWPEQWL